MSEIINSIPMVLKMWKEINPQAKERSSKARAHQLRRLDKAFEGKKLCEITESDLVSFTKGEIERGKKRSSILIELRLLEDVFIVNGLINNLVSSFLMSYRKKNPRGLRHRGKPEYARKLGYKIFDRVKSNYGSSGTQEDSQPKPENYKVVLLDGDGNFTSIKAYNFEALLLDAMIVLNEKNKEGVADFVVRFVKIV